MVVELKFNLGACVVPNPATPRGPFRRFPFPDFQAQPETRAASFQSGHWMVGSASVLKRRARFQRLFIWLHNDIKFLFTPNVFMHD